MTPPPSRAAFQVMPNSLREIVVAAVKPARVVPNASTATPLNSVSSSTSRETPRRVRVPVTVPSPPSRCTPVMS